MQTHGITGTATVHIDIPALDVAHIEVHVRGTTPLITNRFSERTMLAIEAAQQHLASERKGRGKAPRVPQQEFEDAQYRDPAGNLYIPALFFKRSTVIAAMRFAGDKGTQAEGAFNLPTEMLYPDDDLSTPIMQTDRVVLAGPQHTTSLAYRPRFDTWGVWVPITVVTSFTTIERVLTWLSLAGTSVGIGSWRPEKKGPYGQFKIVDIVSDTAPRAMPTHMEEGASNGR